MHFVFCRDCIVASQKFLTHIFNGHEQWLHIKHEYQLLRTACMVYCSNLPYIWYEHKEEIYLIDLTNRSLKLDSYKIYFEFFQNKLANY